MDSMGRGSGRLAWVAALGVVVMSGVVVFGVVAQANRSTTVDPSGGNTGSGDAVNNDLNNDPNADGINGVGSTTLKQTTLSESGEPLATNTTSGPPPTAASQTDGPAVTAVEAYEQCLAEVTITVTLPCGPAPDGWEPSPQTQPPVPPTSGPSDIEGCNQVTTIPDCADLVGNPEPVQTTEGPTEQPPVCLERESPTTRSECYATTTAGPLTTLSSTTLASTTLSPTSSAASESTSVEASAEPTTSSSLSS